MGLLLMQFEYQRAIQKKTVLEHKGVRLNNMHDLYTKRIGNIEKLFSKKKTQLESKYTRLNSQISQKLNYASAYGAFGAGISLGTIFDGVSTAALAGLQTAIDADWGTTNNVATTKTVNDQEVKLSDTELYNSQKSKQAAVIAQLQSALQTILEELKEAELAELEEKEDAQTAPIAEKDTDMQAEIAVNDTRLTMADERAQAAKQRLAQVAKDSMAHYGLNA